MVFNESRKLNTRTQNVTYCTFFAGVRLLDAAENGTYLTPQQLFDVPVQLSDDGAKVLRKLFSLYVSICKSQVLLYVRFPRIGRRSRMPDTKLRSLGFDMELTLSAFFSNS